MASVAAAAAQVDTTGALAPFMMLLLLLQVLDNIEGGELVQFYAKL